LTRKRIGWGRLSLGGFAASVLRAEMTSNSYCINENILSGKYTIEEEVDVEVTEGKGLG